jgi:hypothetical protein
MTLAVGWMVDYDDFQHWTKHNESASTFASNQLKCEPNYQPAKYGKRKYEQEVYNFEGLYIQEGHNVYYISIIKPGEYGFIPFCELTDLLNNTDLTDRARRIVSDITGTMEVGDIRIYSVDDP